MYNNLFDQEILADCRLWFSEELNQALEIVST